MKQLKFKLILLMIGLFIGIFFGELFSRVYFFGNAGFSYSKTNSFGILSNSELLQYSKTKGLRYELLPNLDTTYKLFKFRTNNEGFRDRNHQIKKNKKRIAVLGDSFVMGTGVSEESLYVQKTEQLLATTPNKNKYELFNFGVSGYGLNEYIKVLKKNVLKYNPNLVLIGFCAQNDQIEEGNGFFWDDFIISPKKNVFWESYLKKLLYMKLKPNKNEPIVYKPEQLSYVNKKFNELQTILSADKIKGLLFYTDLVYDPLRVLQIKKIAIQNQFLFLDASIFFKDKNLASYIVNELDPHPNHKSNLIFAEKLKEYIETNERYLFPE